MRRICGLVAAAASVFLVAPANAAPSATAAAAQPSAFTSMSPVRVLDTRIGVGGSGLVGPRGTVTLDLSTAVPAATTAVVLNVTGTAPTASTFVSVYPSGTTLPATSNLNLVAGETRPNLVTVALGADRKIKLYNNAGSVHLIADLAGYYSTGSTGRFTAFSAIRVLDTRTQFEFRPPGPLGPNKTEALDLSDRVPDSATAVVVNVTGTGATADTFVTAWPSGKPRPTASNLNPAAGATAPNQVVVALGADRKINLYNGNGSVHLVVDLAGFYTPDYGALFTPVSPSRVLDTRNGTGVPGPVHGTVSLRLNASVPANTTSVVMNVTGTQSTVDTFVSVWPSSEPMSTSSVLNLRPGQTAPNLVTVGVGGQASVNFYNNTGSAHLIADLAGYFSLPPADCAADCVFAWGRNDYGGIGTGSYEPANAVARPVYGLSGVTAVSADDGAGYALLSDGTVRAWGMNYAGNLGNGWTGGKSMVPVPVVGLDDVVAIDGSMALRGDGTVWAWGTMPNAGYSEPGQVPGLTDVVAIATGNGTGYALKSDGTVWAWGANGFGALGTGSPDYYSATPVQVPGLTGAVRIESGMSATYVLKDDGTVWAWGDNRQGQLGAGTVGGDGCYSLPTTAPNCYSDVPVQVHNLTNVTEIGADAGHGFAVLADGTAWSWGENYRGGLGSGQDCGDSECSTGTPVRVSGLTGVVDIAGFQDGGYARTADGRVWAWGNNEYGALGHIDTPQVRYSAVPVRLQMPSGTTAIAAGFLNGFALVP